MKISNEKKKLKQEFSLYLDESEPNWLFTSLSALGFIEYAVQRSKKIQFSEKH